MNITFSCLKNNAVNVNSPSCEADIHNDEEILLTGQSQPDPALGLISAQPEMSGVVSPQLYFSVINFPTGKKFKMKVKNKQIVKKWQDWTSKDQQVLFKRKINEWRKIAEGDIRIVPEFTKDYNLHFNLIYKSILSVRDIDIIITDAYSIDHNTRRYFVNTKKVHDLDGLNKYLKKEEGKQYQYTGMEWNISNV